MNGNTTTRRGVREIISISLPVSLYENLSYICKTQNLNRSAVITSAIEEYLRTWQLTRKEDQHGV